MPAPAMVALVTAGLGAVAAASGWRWLSKSASRTVDVPRGAPIALFTGGGISCSAMNSDNWTAQLELFDWGIKISGAGPLELLVPTWEARYDELIGTGLLTTPFSGRPGVWFRARGTLDAVVYWTRDGQDILAWLGHQGVTSIRPPVRLQHRYDIPTLR